MQLPQFVPKVLTSDTLWNASDGMWRTQERKIFADLQAWMVEEGIMTIDEDPSPYFINVHLPKDVM